MGTCCRFKYFKWSLIAAYMYLSNHWTCPESHVFEQSLNLSWIFLKNKPKLLCKVSHCVGCVTRNLTLPPDFYPFPSCVSARDDLALADHPLLTLTLLPPQMTLQTDVVKNVLCGDCGGEMIYCPRPSLATLTLYDSCTFCPSPGHTFPPSHTHPELQLLYFTWSMDYPRMRTFLPSSQILKTRLSSELP